MLLKSFRLKGTSECPSFTRAPRKVSCEVRPGFLGLCLGGTRSPSRTGACHYLGNLYLPAPCLSSWGKVPVHSLNPPHFPSHLVYLVLPHKALEKPVCPSTSLYIPSRHWGVSDVPLNMFLLQAG